MREKGNEREETEEGEDEWKERKERKKKMNVRVLAAVSSPPCEHVFNLITHLWQLSHFFDILRKVEKSGKKKS